MDLSNRSAMAYQQVLACEFIALIVPFFALLKQYDDDMLQILLSATNKLTYLRVYAIDIAWKRSMLAPYRQVPKNISAN
jgi:hypothetical protein